jgi:SAM-dependent methyltransferase
MHLDDLRGLYGRDYYLDDCEGHREFQASNGARLPRRLAKCLALMDVRCGDRVLDVGCGRGELALHAARSGAICLAVDPSRAGLDLLGEAMADWDLRGTRRPWRLVARGEHLPVASGSVDCAILSDVVEHLEPDTLDALLSDCHRVVRPGGRVVVHTQPNRKLVQYTVPVLSRLSFLWGVSLPRDLRDEMTPGARAPYHVNEQSRGDLEKSLLRARFEIGELWLEGSYPIHRIFGDTVLKNWILPRFRRWSWLKELLASQLFAVARKDR